MNVQGLERDYYFQTTAAHEAKLGRARVLAYTPSARPQVQVPLLPMCDLHLSRLFCSRESTRTAY